MVPSDDLKKYVLKQFVHNDSGQFLVGEKEENLYLLVPGLFSNLYTSELFEVKLTSLPCVNNGRGVGFSAHNFNHCCH